MQTYNATPRKLAQRTNTKKLKCRN